MKRFFVIAVFLLASCGSSVDKENHRSDPQVEMRQQIMELQQELLSIVDSDYATCSSSLSQAVQNICKIAQAATVEARAEMQGALADLASRLESKIQDTQVDVDALSGMWTRIYGVDFPATTGAATPTEAECSSWTGNASVVECVKVQGTALDNLQNAVDDLTNTVSGTTLPVAIGEENISAGPVYENVIRWGDQSRINAYADGLHEGLTLGGNPLTATNGSPTLTITAAAHGLAVGNFINMTACQSGKGFTAAHLNGEFEIATVPTVNTFTITMAKNATSGGAFGASSCLIRRYTGNGFTSIWTSADGSDVTVRKTTSGSKSYNFAICETTASEGKLCYSSTDRTASFATISAIPGWDTTCASSGSIVCK